MTDAGEAGAAVLLFFFGIIIVSMVRAALLGGDVSGLASIASDLALPVVILAIIISVGVAIANSF